MIIIGPRVPHCSLFWAVSTSPLGVSVVLRALSLRIYASENTSWLLLVFFTASEKQAFKQNVHLIMLMFTKEKHRQHFKMP